MTPGDRVRVTAPRPWHENVRGATGTVDYRQHHLFGPDDVRVTLDAAGAPVIFCQQDELTKESSTV
jgi:hypothetical protein